MILGKRFVPLLFVLLCLGAVVLRAQAGDSDADTRDTLVYKDGDRIRGRLVEKTGNLIVFKSDRFGELRVPAGDAVIIKGEAPATKPVTKEVVAAGIKPSAASKQARAHAKAREQEQQEEEKLSIWNRFSPAVLTAHVRDFFGPWHGGVSFSNELVTDTAHHDNISIDGKLARKFSHDSLDLSAHYDYDQTDHVTATDMLKGIASWRHDFSKRQFTQYRPTVEWDRGTARDSQYVLVQQELGYGISVWARPTRTVRLGVSENMFDVWSWKPGAGHGSRAVASLFDETELTLPWRMTINQRAVWYPETRPYGWEDKIELSKKLTETLSVSLRHEIRRHNPDARDYTRLKLLLGLDF